MRFLAGLELVSLGILAVAVCFRIPAALIWGHLLLQVVLLAQIILAMRVSQAPELDASLAILDRNEKNTFPFLFFLFLIAAIPGYLDPSWKRLQDFAQLDSTFDFALSRILPSLFSGITAIWFAVGILVILAAVLILRRRLKGEAVSRGIFSFLPFLAISALYTGLFIALLVKAIDWEISKLDLKSSIAPLFILLAGGGGILSFVTFQRLASHAPGVEDKSLIGMVGFSMGAILVFPLIWLLIRSGRGRRPWRLLLGCSLVGSLLLGSYILYGDLFNPWFTAFSYLKGAILKGTAVAAAGILVLIFEEILPVGTRIPGNPKVEWILIVVIFFGGFLPFIALDRYPEVKTATLQFNEIARVDAAYIRALSNRLGFMGPIRLGQNPELHRNPMIWPLPWTLEKTGTSRLPKDFNLLVIVVDALRGDAFHSAGYHRNLTPFLDKWAREEAISFRRAYSQGGGSFAAFPFLVGGRSRFTLYGPDLYQKNLYFMLAQAEGIKKIMLQKGVGPRAMFPPDFPLIELGGSRVGSEVRSDPADEVFGWAEEAIDKLGEGERFLCFLYLLDVHNDLWKKDDGLDFGDNPRDLYDNNLSYTDRAFERFVAWLKQKGIYERTVILFTSDHGEQFWEHGASLHGHTLYEEEIRIPLILLSHGIQKRVEDVPVIAADMAPTIVELSGYKVHPPYDDPHMGISLLPLLLENEKERYLKRDVVGRASFKRRYFLYRDWEWKLVYFAELDLLQLFNTVEDPGEKRNLLEEKPALAGELEGELLRYLQRVEGKNYRPLLSD
jgi:glucan phosphoethanolaminetransferase (alkaline phosphatase superfamily)